MMLVEKTFNTRGEIYTYQEERRDKK